jgi:hypothetical protein
MSAKIISQHSVPRWERRDNGPSSGFHIMMHDGLIPEKVLTAARPRHLRVWPKGSNDVCWAGAGQKSSRINVKSDGIAGKYLCIFLLQNPHLRSLVLRSHLRNTYGTQSVTNFNSSIQRLPDVIDPGCFENVSQAEQSERQSQKKDVRNARCADCRCNVVSLPPSFTRGEDVDECGAADHTSSNATTANTITFAKWVCVHEARHVTGNCRSSVRDSKPSSPPSHCTVPSQLPRV